MPNYNPLSTAGRGNKPVYKPKNTGKALLNLFKYLLKYKYRLILAIFLSLASSLLALIGPYLSGKCIDAIDLGTGKVDFDTVYFYIILLVVFYVLSSVLSYILALIMLSIAQSTGKSLRDDVFKKLKKLPVSYYDQHQSGDVISTLSYDIDTVTSALSTDVVSIASAVVSVFGSLIMMLTIKPLLTLVFVVTVPISFIITRKMSKKSKRLFKKRSNAFGVFGGFAEERISGLFSIKAYGREEEILEQFDNVNDDSMIKAYNAEYYSSKTGPFVNFVNNLSLTFITIFGAILFLYGKMSIGNISSFVLYSRKFSGPINETLNMFAEIQSALAASERVFAILEEKEEAFDAPVLVNLEHIQGNVEFKNIDFSYNEEKKILKDINFFAKKGSLTAIVGETGSGKTTLINLLMKFYLPDEGNITLDEVDTYQIKASVLRKYFAMVLQDSFLFEGTIKENIAYGCETATDEEIINAAKLAYADTFISRLKDGYDTMIYESGNSISKGQKQLLTIARAFLNNANMLILDEATSSVDTRTEKHIQEAMIRLMKEKTCFVIAHRLSTIRNADCILVVSKGEIIERGTHEELLEKKGTYYTLYQSQYK